MKFRILFALLAATGALTGGFSAPASAYDTSYFPATIGNSWDFNSQWYDGINGGLRAGQEAVVVQGDGTFKSVTNLNQINNNTVKITSITSYAPCDAPNSGALCVPTTKITLDNTTIMIFIPPPPAPPIPIMIPFTTTTVTDSTYGPPELWFPAGLANGTVESRTSTHTSVVTVNGGSSSSSSSSQLVTFTVYPVESVTVPAGTFQAVKVVETIANTEANVTTTTTVEEWFAPNVGLVKSLAYTYDLNPPNLTVTQARDLVSYSIVAPTNRQLDVVIQGTGTVTSVPAGINCTGGSPNGCSAPYANGDLPVLTATPPWYSTIDWLGCTVDTLDNAKCFVAMTADKRATFSVIPKQVLFKGNSGSLSTGHDSLSAAIADINADSTILARDTYIGTPPESLRFETGHYITLAGGLAADWTTHTATLTSVTGTLTITSGKLSVTGVRIKK